MPWDELFLHQIPLMNMVLVWVPLDLCALTLSLRGLLQQVSSLL